MKYEKVELISRGPSLSKPKPPPEKVGLSIPDSSSSQPNPPPKKVELSSPVSSSSKPKPPPEKLSPMALATLKVVKERTQKRVSRRTPDVVVKYFDNTRDRYDWLLPGWIAEERFVPTGHRGAGRIYKPWPKLEQVETTAEKVGLISPGWSLSKPKPLSEKVELTSPVSSSSKAQTTT
ncbi:hypothetical protein V6N13_092414 [Hibiscus sabdariffa]|uniref:Uncharacterized protein n=1 Tax=Hibiscus sabdariffa TaxID=183260 RepID=A0ABR2CCA1_9ROSI